MPSKILVVDENLAASKLAEGVLAQHFNGGDVMVAQRATDAFERFSIAQPDLILVNDTLPDLDVESVCYRLLNDPATSAVPVVIMGMDGKAGHLEARYSNVVRTLPKPITPESLQELFSSTIDKSGGLVNPARSLL